MTTTKKTKRQKNPIFRAAMIIAVIAVIAASVSAQDIDTVSDADGDTVAFNMDSLNAALAGLADTDVAPDTGVFGAGQFRQQENYIFVLLRITGYLVIVTAIIFAAAWGIRKLGLAGVSKVSTGKNMDVIESIYIGQNRGAALIRVSDSVYLIGHTPENIVLIEKIEGDKAIDLIASAKSTPTITSFKDVFNGFMGKMRKRDDT